MLTNNKKTIKSFVLRYPVLAEKVYRALAFFRAKKAMFTRDTFGQCEEDAWFLSFLRERQIQWADSGFYVDLGANHPVVYSATYLLYKAGWSGITVDPIPSLCALHRRLRPRDFCLNAGVGPHCEKRRFWETVPDFFSSFSEMDTKRAMERRMCTIIRESELPLLTPATILEKSRTGRKVNYLSIDTEGLDGEILRSWPWDRSLPDVVSCEASALMENESEADLILKQQGYSVLARFPICVFWVSPMAISSLARA
jgi:FkbM family methyltransferase